jgi:hypothetical protein
MYMSRSSSVSLPPSLSLSLSLSHSLSLSQLLFSYNLTWIFSLTLLEHNGLLLKNVDQILELLHIDDSIGSFH